MAQSLTRILVHLVFSTKNRIPLIPKELQAELNAYFIGILKQHDSPALMVGSMEDHVHILFLLSKNYAFSKIVQEIKTGSSKWIKTRIAQTRQFQWQNGYGAFSVSQSNTDSVREYIADQDQHHHKMTFQEELLVLLKKHKVDYDERYLWD